MLPKRCLLLIRNISIECVLKFSIAICLKCDLVVFANSSVCAALSYRVLLRFGNSTIITWSVMVSIAYVEDKIDIMLYKLCLRIKFALRSSCPAFNVYLPFPLLKIFAPLQHKIKGLLCTSSKGVYFVTLYYATNRRIILWQIRHAIV